jgi:AAHS family benzoate transporter-like MFS transporter
MRAVEETSMTLSPRTDPQQDLHRRRTVTWVVGLATLGLMFDGYDLVVYGTVVSTFLRNPNEIGQVTPAAAGALGSYALVGVLVGALAAGAVGDIIGRRKIMLVSYAWFAVFMGVTALATGTAMFGIGRFLTGIGVGALVGTTGAIVAEFAPPGKKNLCNAITYSGVPFGSLLAALLGILLLGAIGWRGMFWIGALPLVTLLPLAYFKMPESVAWLVSRGRITEAREVSARTGMPLPEELPPAPAADESAAAGQHTGRAGNTARAGYGGLFDRRNWLPTVLLGLTSAMVLLLVYSLNTWLPELMLRAGFNAKGSLAFLLVLNGGAVVGALTGSRVADRFGPKLVTAAFLLTGAVFIAALIVPVPLGVLLAFVALAGLGTSGTQILLFGFVANYYRTNVRAAAVAWCAGFGRLGGVGGPLVGGILIGVGLGVTQIFLILAGVAVVGLAFVLLVPHRRERPTVVTVDPSRSVALDPSAPAARP